MTLPTSLSGHYLRYKEDTSTFSTWLHQAATKCGYKWSASTTTSHRSRKSPSSITYPVRELLSQAKAVASSVQNCIKLPRNVLRAAQRAITARHEFNQHFQLIDAQDKLNATHAHFIAILTDTLTILEPITPKSTKSGENGHSTTNRLPNNAFAALKVEDIEDSDDAATDEPLWTKSDKMATVEILEDEDHAIHVQIDNAIRVLSLFEDLYDIRIFVQQSWQKYEKRAVDLSTVSMVTNAAMALIMYECQYLAEELGIDPKSSYRGFLRTTELVTEESPDCSLEDLLKGQSSLGRLTCVEIAVTLEEYIKAMKKDMRVHIFPYIPALRVIHRDPDFKALLSRFPILDELMTRQAMLGQMFVNFGRRERANRALPMNEAVEHRQVIADELMKAIGCAIADRAVSTEAVIAAKIWYDIEAILGKECNRPFKELCDFAANGTKAFHHTNITSDVRSGPQWGKDDEELILNIHANFEAVETLRETSVKTSVMKSVAFRGLQMLNMELLVEDSGVRLANYHSSLIIMSYLYNASNQKNLLSVQWPELDLAITAHKDSLFFGRLPTTPKDIAMRFALRHGLPLTAYLDLDPEWLKPPKEGQRMTRARSGGKNSGDVQSKLNGNCLKMSKTSQALEQYFNGQESLIRVIHSVVAIADKDKRGIDTGSKHAARTLGPVAFLSQLQEWLVVYRKFLKLDYIQLTRDCHTLMKEISKVIKPRYEEDGGHLFSAADRKLIEDDRNNVPGAPTTHTVRYLDVTHKILVDNQGRTEYAREFKVLDDLGMSEGALLEKASHFVQRFIEEKNTKVAKGAKVRK